MQIKADRFTLDAISRQNDAVEMYTKYRTDPWLFLTGVVKTYDVERGAW